MCVCACMHVLTNVFVHNVYYTVLGVWIMSSLHKILAVCALVHVYLNAVLIMCIIQS